MATFYHHHINNTTELTAGTGDSTTGHDQLHHTFILMNPNFASGYPGPHHPQPPPPPPPQPHAGPQSHNILLLNSAATANHHYVRPMLPPQQDSITLYGYPHSEAREITRPRQGLSLSLSSQQHTQYGTQPHHDDVEGDVARSVMGSRYLKAAQELLEEVVNVGHGLFGKNSDSKWASPQPQKPGKGTVDFSDEKAGGGSGGGSGEGDGDGESVQLSSADRQELQMKKAKLVTMLDEAEQKYRQYQSQMQIVIHSFEQAAGVGSAKTYTALALKTISKQFRCLKDAIQGQIKAAGKSLGEGGGSGSTSGKIEGSRLKYIDHQIRQQRALQQLGVMQNHNAWRPQRGLPERSVSVLRAWLFEHFLHPYPKDSDKIILAKQTGLTRSQVSNWFINARVRLWKPMIEEMYSEELKEQEQQNRSEEQKTNSKENSHGSNSTNNQEKNTNITSENQPNTTLKDQNTTISSPSSSSPSLLPIPTTSSLPFKGNGFSFSGSLEAEHISQGSPKRPRNEDVLHCVSETEFIKFGNDQKQERDNSGYSILPEGMNFVGGGEELESYPSLGEIGRFTHEFQPTRFFPGNGISLSLGLPPCENQQLNITATNHTYLSQNHNIQFRRASDFGSMNSPPQHSTPSAFECLDIQNRKGFAAPLLPDFVA